MMVDNVRFKYVDDFESDQMINQTDSRHVSYRVINVHSRCINTHTHRDTDTDTGTHTHRYR
jgi:hypothetical protein